MATTKKTSATDASVKTAAPPSVAPKVASAPLAKTVAKTPARPVAKRSAPLARVASKPPVKSPALAKADKPAKAKKPKLVRDSFTIPKTEYIVLDELKQRAGKLEISVKKSELLRAGIKALAALSDLGLLAALNAVPTIKTGRPAKNQAR
jgi:hypothetical protein